MTATTTARNSTTVRFDSLAQRVALEGVRLGFRALSATAPSLATIAAESLFRRPRRHRRPAWERAIVELGARSSVAHAGATLPAWSFGDGPLVVLVHGWEGRGSQLGAHVAPLVAAGYRVLFFDAPGHGDAEGDRSSVIEIAQALRSVIDQFGAPHAIIAHSVGCVASTFVLGRAALPVAPKLVFYAPPLSPRRFTEHFARVVGVPEDVRASMARRVEARYGIALSELEMLSAARGRSEPLLVVHDQHDSDVPLASGQALAREWTGARLHATAGLGHRRILRDRRSLDAALRHVTDGRATIESNSEEKALFRELFEREQRSVDQRK